MLPGSRGRKRYGVAVILLIAAGSVCATGPLVGGNKAVTKPSGDVTLSFPRPGRVAKIYVKEGQAVRAGELLVQQDDVAEVLQLRELKLQAENTVKIRYAEKQAEQKKLDYEKVMEAGEKGAAPEMEVRHAKLDWESAVLSLELTQFEHTQDELKYAESNAQIERMRLTSPIDGRVEKIALQEGESKDAQQPILRIVKIDPLWIDVPVPLRDAWPLSVGGAARIDFPMDPNVGA
jgi:RND family efflux transporter MFP subunit